MKTTKATAETNELERRYFCFFWETFAIGKFAVTKISLRPLLLLYSNIRAHFYEENLFLLFFNGLLDGKYSRKRTLPLHFLHGPSHCPEKYIVSLALGSF